MATENGEPPGGQVIAYCPQLDSLRAIAVLCVLLTHFASGVAYVGDVAVLSFFVLSGYLITRILLVSKGDEEASTWHLLGIFYLRRGLRIFPLYYLVLAGAWMLDLEGMRATIRWHLTYLTNIWYFEANSWTPWPTNHLWTLSVEEQFYLVWPLIVLFLPRKILPGIALAAMAGAVLFRAILSQTMDDGVSQVVLTPAHMDALGAGALLAMMEEAGWVTRRTMAGLSALSAVCAAWLIGSLLGWLSVPSDQMFRVGAPLAMVVILMTLVATLRAGVRGPVGVVLDHPVPRYIGKISYGIYLLHMFVLAFAIQYLARILPNEVLQPGAMRFVAFTLATFALASSSWHFFEGPVNQLKKHVTYRSGPRARALSPRPALVADEA